MFELSKIKDWAMESFEKRREESIKRAFLYANQFEEAEKKAARLLAGLNREQGNTLATRLNTINTVVDFSFKLYIVHHTNTEEELAQLDHCCTLLWSIKHCYDKEKLDQSIVAVQVIKAIYPLLDKGNTDLAKLSSFYANLFTHQESPLDSVEFTHAVFCYFFVVAIKFADIFVEAGKNMLDFFKLLPAHNATSTASKPYWKYVKPVFENCAAEIPLSPTPEQIGHIFNRHFKATQAEIEEFKRKLSCGGDMEEPQKLELVLRLHGLWNKAQYDDGSFEEEDTLRSRMRRNWCKTFRNWYEKEQKDKRTEEERILQIMEKHLWKRIDPKLLALPIAKAAGVDDVTQIDPDALSVLQNITAELNRRYQWDIKA